MGAARIRFAEPADAPQVRAIYAPFCNDTSASFELVAPTEAEMAGRIAQILPRLPWLVCTLSEMVAGYVYARPYHPRAAYQWTVEVSVYVSETFRRHGVARGLYISLFALLQQQGYCHALASVTLPNPASEGLHRAVGFEQVGTLSAVGYKLQQWHDVGWFQKRLQLLDNPPCPPTDLAELRRLDLTEEALAVGLPLIHLAR